MSKNLKRSDSTSSISKHQRIKPKFSNQQKYDVEKTFIGKDDVIPLNDSRLIRKLQNENKSIQPKVFDQEGHDVTPKPLTLTIKKKLNGLQETNEIAVAENVEDIKHVSNMEKSLDRSFVSVTSTTSSNDLQKSYFNNAKRTSHPFSRTIFGSIVVAAGQRDQTLESFETFHNFQTSKKDEKFKGNLMWKKGNIDDEIEVHLSESDNVSLLELPSITVPPYDSEEMERVTQQNERYAELSLSRDNSDKYVSRSMNTFNNGLKAKFTQTALQHSSNKETYVSKWDLYDTYETNGSTIEDSFNVDKNGEIKFLNEKDDTSIHFLQNDAPLDFNEILNKAAFKYSLLVLERAMQMNTSQNKQAAYLMLPGSHFTDEGAFIGVF
ncbi:hypothetical protein HELRODRAFT_162397 [Helobdella robusta]|uniref:Uncharacterized protein n=1 Tax=Helobdella robusta TaxID=6412 RepID=T1ESL8_HELRO|nr:hypothetical protein HELRODRAFT_162397 [Helobdella robusta]ESN98927.1 hypothetical protein HELRODRAFT_162397 [Helobdella robusta]